MKKLLHALTNVYTAMTDKPGPMSGTTIRVSERHREDPSTQAASSRSRGTLSMNARPIHVANGSDVAVRNQTAQNLELIRFVET